MKMTVSIIVQISSSVGRPVMASQEFLLPKPLPGEELSPLANKIIRAGAAAAGVKIPKVKG